MKSNFMFRSLALTLSVAVNLLMASGSHAQQVDVKGIDSGPEGNTTIEIKKGAKESLGKTKWETQSGEADVEGEASATTKDAKKAWQTACTDWKKEIRNDNKENKVLSVNCGAVSCGGDAGSKVCSSKATYKIKTKMEE